MTAPRVARAGWRFWAVATTTMLERSRKCLYLLLSVWGPEHKSPTLNVCFPVCPHLQENLGSLSNVTQVGDGPRLVWPTQRLCLSLPVREPVTEASAQPDPCQLPLKDRNDIPGLRP